jgi:hypothetical protein
MNSEKRIISVYKTSISHEDISHLKIVLDNFTKITKWNTDLDDCDNILRIESQFSVENKVIRILSMLKIKCIELK